MATKKVYKLKLSVKILIVILVISAIATPFCWKKYQEYLYTKTNEYALFNLGYKEDEVKLILDKLNDEEEEKLFLMIIMSLFRNLSKRSILCLKT